MLLQCINCYRGLTLEDAVKLIRPGVTCIRSKFSLRTHKLRDSTECQSSECMYIYLAPQGPLASVERPREIEIMREENVKSLNKTQSKMYHVPLMYL